LVQLLPPPPSSTLFPYTTLFRSLPAPESLVRPAHFIQEAYMRSLIPRDTFFQDLFDFRRDFDQIFNRFLSWPSGQEESTMTAGLDRKSTRLNSSHSQISYAVFCL